MSNNIDPYAMTDQEYNDWMQGFCAGFPLEGEPDVTIDNPESEYYQNGLSTGQADFDSAGRPMIRYDG